jgi:hypothetical protein
MWAKHERSRGVKLASFVVCGAFGVATALPTRAESLVRAETTVPFRVEYAVDSLCAETDRFSMSLLDRTDRAHRAKAAERATEFRVGVERDGTSLAGHLTVVDLDGSTIERRVPGATCDEVVSAMALIAAVLVDPNASLPRTAEPRSPAVEPVPRAEPERDRLRFGGGALVALEGAVAPSTAVGLAVELALSWDTQSTLSPLVALSFARTLTSTAETSSGVASFRWTAARISGCPVRFPATGPLALRPCALLDLGAIDAMGEQTERPDSALSAWVATGGALRAEGQPIDELSLVLEGGMVVPLIRDRFYFDPGITAFEVPDLGAMARLGVVTRFR